MPEEEPLRLGDEFDELLECKGSVGDLKIYVGDREGRLFIAFDRSIKHVGIPPEDALLLAHTIIQRVMKMQDKFKEDENSFD